MSLLLNDLLEGAVRFHGHLGPFLVLGLKAGLSGVDYLGKDYFELKAEVETALHPPRSCFIDGIQFASGCTIGKGNLKIKAGDGVSVEFTRGERKINIVIKKDILEVLDGVSSETQEIISREIMQKTSSELFLMSKI